jgi:hypothetical protein
MVKSKATNKRKQWQIKLSVNSKDNKPFLNYKLALKVIKEITANAEYSE